MYETRQYAVFSVSEIDKVDFSLVCEFSADTLRYNKDQTKTFVKWDNEQPEFVSELITLEGPYTYDEILEILSGDDWKSSMEEDQ